MKKLIIIISIIITILLLIIVGLYFISKNKNLEVTPEEGRIQERREYSKVIQEVTNLDDFYSVQDCVKKFFTYYSTVYDTDTEISIIDEETEKYIKNNKVKSLKAIYNMLSPEYRTYKQITETNILEKLKEKTGTEIDIIQMYISEYNENISRYFVKGTLRNKISNALSNFYIIVELDSTNQTFGIFLEDYIDEKYGEIKLGEDLNINFNEAIDKNEYNIYERKVIDEQTYILDLFGNYKTRLLFNPELAYNSLNEEYRKSKFENMATFKKYLKENTKKHVSMKLKRYQKNENNDYTQYVGVDENGDYIIFRLNSVINYNVILDTYTIDLPEFTEKYTKASDEEKVLLNIQKCFTAINDKDYRYVYNKLDNTFKANNFKTLADFEKYINANFFEKNKISASNARKKSEVYLYDIKISNIDGTSSITKTFVMQLKENTDFVMSFGV